MLNKRYLVKHHLSLQRVARAPITSRLLRVDVVLQAKWEGSVRLKKETSQLL